MPKGYSIPLFYLTAIFFLSSQTIIANDVGLKIKKINLDGKTANWGEYFFDRVAYYEKLDKDGMPKGLIIYVQFKRITFFFGVNDTTVYNYRYKLLEHNKPNNNNWCIPKFSNEITLKNLNFGEYSFVLQALKSGKVQDEKILNFEKHGPKMSNISTQVMIILICSLIFAVLVSVSKTKQNNINE